jgi:hypothetical protein
LLGPRDLVAVHDIRQLFELAGKLAPARTDGEQLALPDGALLLRSLALGRGQRE